MLGVSQRCCRGRRAPRRARAPGRHCSGRRRRIRDARRAGNHRPIVRLDLPEDQARLRETVAALRPTLLVLDPFVRLHRIDKNAAADVAPLLAYLRDLERHFHTAVLLVHHARKGAAHARAGQALRGSSELHAWGDSNLYLRRRGDTLCLAIEHRAAPSRDGLIGA